MTPVDKKELVLSDMDCAGARSVVCKLLFFPVLKDVQPEQIFSTLKHGLDRTFETLPLLGGTIKSPSNEIRRGQLVVTEPWCSADECLAWKDLRGDPTWNYEDLKRKHFPMAERQSGESPFRPRSMVSAEGLAVFRAMLTLIQGGYVLTLAINHCFTDGNGTAFIARTWCRLCNADVPSATIDDRLFSRDILRGQPGLATTRDFPELLKNTPPKLKADTWTTRSILSPILKMIKSSFEFVYHLANRLMSLFRSRIAHPPNPRKPFILSMTPKSLNVTFFFSYARLKELKTMVSDELAVQNPQRWISTNDALVALLCCSFIEARKSRYLDFMETTKAGPSHDTLQYRQEKACPLYFKYNEGQKSNLRVAINGRHLLDPPAPADFIGNVIFFADIRICLDEVAATLQSVTTIASCMRESIKEIDKTYVKRMLSAFTTVSDLQDCWNFDNGIDGYDLLVSSWRTQSFYTQGWENVFGVACDIVRRTGLPLDGVMITMPEMAESSSGSDSGGLEVSLGVMEDDVPYLKKNTLLNRFVIWR